MFKRFFPLLAVAAMVSTAFGVEWMTDLEAAKAKAKAEKKLILMDFTGSDWCTSCKIMRKKILDTPEFDAYAKEKFVCLEVDMPHTTPQPEKLQKQNGYLAEKYEVRVYPTIVVAAPDEQIVGGFLGSVSNMAKMKYRLDLAWKAGKKYRKSAKATGVDRAKCLCAVWQNIPMELRGNFQEMKQEIIKLDTKHETAMVDELKAEEQMKQYYEDVRPAKDAKEFLAVTSKYAPVVMPQNAEEIYRWHLTMLEQCAKTVEDVKEIEKYSRKSMELDPTNTPEEIEDALKEFKDPKAYLEKLIKKNAEADKS